MAARKEEVRQGETIPVRSGRGLTSLRREIDRLFDRFGPG